MVKSNKLKIGLLNPGSLATRHDEFIVAMKRHVVDIMAINETWLHKGEEGRAPVVPGYRFQHTPRPVEIRNRGGGVGFYLRRDLTVRILQYPVCPMVEQMWICVKTNAKSLLVGTAYRPPWLNTHTFLDAISDSLSSFTQYDHIVLLGDFNIDMSHKITAGAKLFSDFLRSHNLLQYVEEPTHFTDFSETLIDVVCADAPVSCIQVDHIKDLSGHAVVVCELNFPKMRPIATWAELRPLKSIDLELFDLTLKNVDWSFISTLTDVNDMVRSLNNVVADIYNLHAPFKKVRIKENNYPWITYNIKCMMAKRDQAQIRARKTKSDAHRIYYKELKAIVNSAIVSEKIAYFKFYVNSKIKEPKTMWKHIKQHVVIKNKDMSLPTHFNDVNAINDHFLNIPGNNSVPIAYLTFYEFHRFTDATFEFKPILQHDIETILNSLKSNAMGCDGISLDMIRLLLPNCLATITTLINKSFETNTYPDIWKQAIIKPISKVSNPVGVTDLRPISILPCMSKIMEKIAYNQLCNYLELNNIFPTQQSGFRRHRGTATALIDVVDNIVTSQANGETTLLTLLDFSRAFETLNVSLLLSKLAYYGIGSNAIKWFESYFKYRLQKVELYESSSGRTTTSTCRQVKRGVPQGSILGPLLFILYSADIITNIKHCKYHLYADDLQVYISFKPCDADEAVARLNSDLERISSWSERNTLVLNPNKTKYMILGAPTQIRKVSAKRLLITIKGEQIDRVSEVRNLGVLMDENLRFERHVIDTARNCFYRLKVLYRIRDYLSVSLRINLCDSLVLSKFNYADTLLESRLLARSKKIIQRVQNACARFCFKIPPRDHVTPYLNNSNILKMDYRRRLHFATLLFGIVKNREPKYLFEKLKWARDYKQVRSLRSNYKLLLFPHSSSASFRGSFKYSATKCWNNLPPPLRNIKTLSTFNLKYKLLLLVKQKLNN